MADTGETGMAASAPKRSAWHPLHWVARSRVLAPGVLVCGVIALASTFLSEHYGGPQLLYALLIGLAFHFIHGNPQAKPGIEFCGRTVLRVGVALLGVRITLNQVSQLGVEVAVVILLALVLTIFMGVWWAKLLGRTREEGILSGGSVAICGASAALAISAVLPQTKANERFTLLAVVAVTVLSTVAMVLYPLLIQVLGLAAGPAGVFLGGTIHDVAQVVAAGMMLGPDAGDTATVVKLFRVMLLMPVVMVISLLYRRQQPAEGKDLNMPLIPGFLLAFVVMMLLASSGLVPAVVVQGATDASRVCLVLAIAAAGIKTSIEELLQLGWKPLMLFVSETLFIGLFVLLAVMGLGLAGAR
ncbi:putative sulfate exporter family transporter [Hydrogenophaga sp.]|uniref:YeiH family protein n=1 Tax=Hydrogenophaga sp. TaxID=1904254 RepID=UPI0025BBAAFA|nr:putative sulfate exporter family transporter [Hydrogenophaga sp.]